MHMCAWDMHVAVHMARICHSHGLDMWRQDLLGEALGWVAQHLLVLRQRGERMAHLGPTEGTRKAPGRTHKTWVIKLDTKNWSKFDDFKSCRANLAGPCGQKEGQVTPAQHRRWACTAAHLQGPKYVYYTCLYSNVQLYISIFFF